MPNPLRVAITGMGVVGPGAVGAPALAALLRSGHTAARKVERFDTSSLRSHSAGLVEGFQPREYVALAKLRRMNVLSRYGVASAKMALSDAALDRDSYPPARIGVALGTTFGPVQTSVDYLKEYVEKGAALAPPQLFAESVANAPGSHIAIEENYRGFNLTFTQRESSALAAAMFASSQIVKGSVSAALSGGVEEINDITFSILDKIGALAFDSGKGEAGRPFDRHRNGMMVGEGAAMLILEKERRAGTPCYASLSGFGLAKDTTASLSDWGSDDSAVARAMKAALLDAELEVNQIDGIFASANGSLRGDLLEQRAIKQLFGQHCPPIVAVKGYFGEYAAGGALQLAAAAVCVREQFLPSSAGFESAEDPDLPVTTAMQEVPLRHILLNSLSAGGGIICAILSRGDE